MEQFFHRMHVRKEIRKRQTKAIKDQWKKDESEARQGSCAFLVKYLGYTEVHASKGADICRQSFHKLKCEDPGFSLAHIFQKNRRRQSTTSRHYMTFHVSSEGIRIVDENDDILADTPIASISFCCPNSQHERGFTYICRGDVPWKWHCHAVEAIEESGERLNNAVGCAFTLCLEKKILFKRQNSIIASSNLTEENVFKTGSSSEGFRKLSVADIQPDPEASRAGDPLPRNLTDKSVTLSIDRPKAPVELMDRKGSLGDTMEAYPYKRRINDSVTEEEMELRNSSDARDFY